MLETMYSNLMAPVVELSEVRWSHELFAFRLDAGRYDKEDPFESVLVHHFCSAKLVFSTIVEGDDDGARWCPGNGVDLLGKNRLGAGLCKEPEHLFEPRILFCQLSRRSARVVRESMVTKDGNPVGYLARGAAHSEQDQKEQKPDHPHPDKQMTVDAGVRLLSAEDGITHT